jgi:predicted amino acid dehydrogenase
MRDGNVGRLAGAAVVLVLGFSAAIVLAGCGGSDSDTAATETTAMTETTGASDTAGVTTDTMAETTDTETSSGTKTPTTVAVTFAGGKVVGGIKRPTVEKGDTVVLVVRSDVADEIHLHGYDLSKDVDAGGVARLRFAATVPGRFEVELENLGLQLADITVQP